MIYINLVHVYKNEKRNEKNRKCSGGGGGLVPEHIRQTLNELWTLNGIFAFLYLHRVICFLLTEKGNDNKYDHFIFQQDSATI